MERTNWSGTSLQSGYWTRRSLLRGAVYGATGLGAAALIGCGDSSSPEATGTASPAATTGGAATGTATEASASTPKTGGRYQIAINQEVASLDVFATGSFTAPTSSSAYAQSRLFKYRTGPGYDSAQRESEGDLVTSFEIVDDLTWILKIREGVKFHNVAPVNGRELDAEDIVFSWQRFVGMPAVKSGDITPYIKDVEALDSNTIQISLNRPYASLLALLTHPQYFWIFPREADGQFDPEQTPIGTGPFIFESHEPSVSIKWNRNPDYFVPGLPYLDGVDLLVVSEYVQQVNQFRAGRLSELVPQAPDVSGIVNAVEGVQVIPTPIANAVGGMGFGRLTPLSPFATDERVRRAVSVTIDRDGLQDAISNKAIWEQAGYPIQGAHNNFVTASLAHFWVDPRSSENGEAAQWFQHDPAEARKLLAAAGADQTPFDLHRTVQAYGTPYDSAAEAIVPMLEEGGFQLDVQVDDYRSQWQAENIWGGEATGMMYGLGTSYQDPEGELNYFFGATSRRNQLQVEDAKLADMMEVSQGTTDDATHVELLGDLQRYLGTKMYFVPFSYSSHTGWAVVQPTVRGYEEFANPSGSSGTGTERVMNLWLDE